MHNNINVAVLLPVQVTMAHELQRVCVARANSATPPFDIVTLVRLLNDCLGVQNRFLIGRQQCAGEFFFHMLENLEFHVNYFSIFF